MEQFIESLGKKKMVYVFFVENHNIWYFRILWLI